jgi:phosphatidylglycerophosphate synthase
MLDEPFRAAFARRLRPVARALGRAGASPNALTLSAFLLSLMAAALVASGWRWSGLSVWLVSRVLDGFDGLVAREGGLSTPFGGFLDVTLDMAAYSVMLVAFATQHPGWQLLWELTLVGYVLASTSTLVLSSLLEARAQRTGNRSVQFTAGLAEAGETTITYVLLTAFPEYADAIGWCWCAVVFITVGQRIIVARRLLHER